MIPSYSTGTASVAANGTDVFNGGTAIWSNGNVKEGDWIIIDDEAITMVLSVVDTERLTIPEWQGGEKTNVPYAIYQNYSARDDSSAIARDVGTLVAALNKEGFIWFVGLSEAEPDPSRGDDGQWAYQPSTGKQWHKEGGVWEFDGVFKTFGAPAPYDNDKTYSLNEVATSDGSSYAWINPTPGAGHAPPNATYWAVLAERGPVGPGATVEVGTVTTGAPGSTASVTNVGTESEAVLNFTIPRGTPGAGDLSSVENLADLGDLVVAQRNLQYQAAGRTGAVAMSTASRLALDIWVEEFGADPTGVADSTAAIQSALDYVWNNGGLGLVSIGRGKFLVSGALYIRGTAVYVRGQGIRATTIETSSADTAVWYVDPANVGVPYWGISDMTVDRSVAAVSGAEGLNCLRISNYAHLENLYFSNHFVAYRLGAASYARIERCEAWYNVSHGFHFQTVFGNQFQWQLTSTLSAQNGGDGYRVEAVNDGATMGDWSNIVAFANGGYGASFLGTSAYKLYNIRWIGGFIGQDNNSEIYLDTYNPATAPHLIQGVNIELPGTYPTPGKPGSGLTASNLGHGVDITANNSIVKIMNSWVNAPSEQCIQTACPNTVIRGCVLQNAGQAASTGVGVYVKAGGGGTISGNEIYNTAGSSQRFGVYKDTGHVRVTIENNEFAFGTGNAIAAVDGIDVGGDVTRYNRGVAPTYSNPSAGASPWTYSNGARPTTLHLQASGGFNGIGLSTIGLPATGSGVPITLQLEPNEGALINYNGTLSVGAVQH